MCNKTIYSNAFCCLLSWLNFMFLFLCAKLINFIGSRWGGALTEGIPRKKLFTFGHFPKGGVVKPESKSLGNFFGPSFGHYGGKGGGVDLFQNICGSFGVGLR